MATPRKRTPSFVAQETESPSDENAAEMFETISETESATTDDTTPEVFVAPEIVPTESAGPRFLETPPPAEVIAPAPTPTQQRRHPRNVPKFSRLKKQ